MRQLTLPFLVISLISSALIADSGKASKSSGPALSSQTPKFGYVNFEMAVSLQEEAKRDLGELDKLESKINEDEQKARVDIEKKMANFRSSVANLSEKARQEKENQLGEEINKLQQLFNQRRTDLAKKKQELIARLENKNRLLLDSIAKNGGYDAIFNAAALVYVSDRIEDVTNKLVEAYNKAYPIKAPGKAPAPAKPAPSKTSTKTPAAAVVPSPAQATPVN